MEYLPTDWTATIAQGAGTPPGALIASCLAAAANGEASGYYDLGAVFAVGDNGLPCDLIEAHRWFNLAALAGHPDAARNRADIADSMTPREIAEAQRRAREWLLSTGRRQAA